jgi:molecular chaperone GrpE
VDALHHEQRGGDDSGGADEEPLPGDASTGAEAERQGSASVRGSVEGDTGAADLRDRWLRAEADLQNFRRRAQRDLEEGVRFAEDRLLLEMIGQLDDLERAVTLAREAGAPDPWVQGVQLVAQRMIDDLARHGVTPMRAYGQPFDPELHEAMLEVDTPPDMEPGRVAQVVREGYRRGSRALRPARVVVSRLPRSEG